MTNGQAATVYQALRKKYGVDVAGGIMVDEVMINGEFGGGSRADAIFMGFTNKSGRRLEGFEIKVSRGDWLRELAKPDKGEIWIDNCHRWWIVATPGAVLEQEVPDGWGLMVMQARGLKTVISAHTRLLTPSWDVVRSVVARHDTLTRGGPTTEALEEEVRTLRQRVRDANAESSTHHHDAIEGARARKIVEAIEETLGHPITNANWSGDINIDDLKRAIQVVHIPRLAESRLKGHIARLLDLSQAVVATVSEMNTGLAKITKLEEGEDHDPDPRATRD